MITVSEVMSTQVSTINSSASIAAAKALMEQEDIRHIPVVNDSSRLVGLVTQRDILRAEPSDLTHDQQAGVDENSIPVETIMTQKVAFTHPEEPLRSAGLKIQRYKYGCLPVIQNDQLVGIITDTDFVGVAIDLIEQMEQMDFTEDF